MIKAFIFDFDGLIIDTENACLQSWLEQYQKYNIELPLSKWELTIGTSNEAFDPLEYLYESANKSFDKQKLLSDQKKSYLQKTSQLPLLPGIMNYLIWAKKNYIKIGLASSSTKAWVVPQLLNQKILPFFDVIRTADDVKNVKPNPELFLSVKNNLDILDFEAVIFEDSQNGIIAGNSANLFTIAVPNSLTKNLDLSEAYFTLNSLDAIAPQNLVKILETGLK